jgi:membrane-associated phospholipid phosphatase
MTMAVAMWLAAIALAMCCDHAFAVLMQNVGIDLWLRHDNKTLAEIIKFPGAYASTILVAIAVGRMHCKRSMAGWFVILATMLSGGINYVLQWTIGRSRPFTLDASIAQPFALLPFRGGLQGFWQLKNLCFPSGHVSLAFATATAVAMLWPHAKWRWIGYAIASIVAIERVLENSHWASDVVAGAALGVGTVHLTAWILTKLMPSREPQVATVA